MELLILFILSQVILVLLKKTFLGRSLFLIFRITKALLKMNYDVLTKIYKTVKKNKKVA